MRGALKYYGISSLIVLCIFASIFTAHTTEWIAAAIVLFGVMTLMFGYEINKMNKDKDKK